MSVVKKALALSFSLGLCAATSAFAGPGLADGAAKFVGNITQSNNVPGPNDQFTQLWNQATAENGCKWGSVEGQRDSYNWTGCDAAYKWARNNGGLFKFHALLWGSQYPSWLESLSVEDTKAEITEWFDAVKERYPDAEMIDVVNEAIRTGNNQYHSNFPNTKIIQAMGGDNNGDYAFITTAFKMARERWPDAILIYNDYNTFQWQKNEGIDLINTIKKNGAPVDVYGQQAHDMMTQGGNANGTGGGGQCMDYTTFKNTLKEIYDKTQIPLMISEYDISTSDDDVQLQCYKEQITAFMEAPYVAGITIWGYIYGQTWTTDGASGIIRNGQDRKAMTWLKEYLATNPGVDETGLFKPAGLRFKTKADISMEQGVAQVAKLEATTKTEGATVSYSILGGTDKDLFALSGSDLSFKEAPTYKASGSNQYKVSLKATAGEEADTLDMTVTILKPQTPYTGGPWAIPGKIEAENYDVGSDENPSYSDNGGADEDVANYREDQVDVIKSIAGEDDAYVVGYTQAGEWLEYTVDVKTEGEYTLTARIASDNATSSFRLFIGDAPITDTVKVENTGSYTTYGEVTAKTAKLSKGSHIIRLVVTGDYFDIDWLNFSNGTTPIEPAPRYNVAGAKQYRVYNLQGAYVGTFHASDLKSLNPGAYMVRSTDGSVNRLIGIKN